MPGISDPGHRLIALCIRHGFPVVPVPGASAFLAALAASGLPTHPFRFNGFLPSKKGERRRILEDLKDHQRTQIFYEAPHRLLETLDDIADVMGNRHIVVAREVTKMHEEFLRGRVLDILKELRQRDRVKGEITLLIDRPDAQSTPPPSGPLKDRVDQLMKEQNLKKMDALKAVAKERGISKAQAYKEFEKN
jgi:16S rRNA (cytidine1402-2'-O)-methyltransferase